MMKKIIYGSMFYILVPIFLFSLFLVGWGVFNIIFMGYIYPPTCVQPMGMSTGDTINLTENVEASMMQQLAPFGIYFFVAGISLTSLYYLKRKLMKSEDIHDE